MRKPYRSDLTDAQWELVQPLIPPAKHGGRPRKVVDQAVQCGDRRLPLARRGRNRHALRLGTRVGQCVRGVDVQRFRGIKHDCFAAGLMRGQIDEVMQIADFLDTNLLAGLAFSGGRRPRCLLQLAVVALSRGSVRVTCAASDPETRRSGV